MESELTLTNTQQNAKCDAVFGAKSFDKAKAGDAQSHYEASACDDCPVADLVENLPHEEGDDHLGYGVDREDDTGPN